MGKKEEKKDEGKTEEEIEAQKEEDAEAAFDEGIGDEETKPPEKEAGTSDEEKDEKGGDKETPKEKKGDKEEKETQPKPDEKGGQKPSYEDLEKAHKETKKWATELAMENAELKKKTPKEEKPKKPDEEEEEKKTPPAVELTDDEKEYLDDYPKMKPIVEKLATEIANGMVTKALGGINPADLSKDVGNLREELQQRNFEFQVVAGFFDEEKGEHVDGHPDAVQVMKSKGFKEYYAKALELNPTIEHLNTPKSVIGFISEYKKNVLKKGADEHKKDQEEITAQGLELGESPEPGSNERGTGEDKDEGNSDTWFEDGIKN